MTKLALKLSTFFVLMTMVTAPAYADIFKSDEAAGPLSIQANDVVMGEENAPVTIIEYASMSCPHCAHFHLDIFKEVKKDYIDTGKVKFVMRDLAWDPLAMAVAKVTRCVDDSEFYNYVSAFFSTQATWSQSKDPVAELKKVARLGGMDEDTFNQCLASTDTHEAIFEMKRIALEELKVNSTPTFFIGDKIVVRGAHDYASFKKEIEKALNSAK